jgi:hypothetical protein
VEHQRRRGKQAQLRQLLDAASPPIVDVALRDRLAAALAPISPRRLRDLLRQTGAPLDCLVEGVRQDSLIELERTLRALATRYANSAELAKQCRRLVIESKDHARMSAKRLPVDSAQRALKDEMLLWMLTWLENPGVFDTWVALRAAAIESRSKQPE